MSEGPRIPDAALAALERVLNRYLALDPEGAAGLAPLHGRVICLELAGFGTRVYLIPGPAGLQAYGDYDAEPDCVLRGTPLGLARMGLTHRKEEQLFSGEVQVEGNTGLAHAFGDAIAGLEPDWEEQLSRLVGDPIAHQVGSGARSAARWGQRSIDLLADDVKEYLQEEGRILPSRYEVSAFLAEVDTLRDDVERLAARVERLTKRSAGSGHSQ